MSTKNMVIFDDNKSKSSLSINDTNITVKNADTGEVLFRGKNKVIVSGSAFTASKHFNITPNVFTPSYNTILNLENTNNTPFNGEGIRREEQVYLFAVGVGGCGQEAKDVYPVDYTKWIQPEDLVPFRYQTNTNDIPEYLRDSYYGRKIQGNRIMYYFKTFETEPVFKQQYVDGTPIDENIYFVNRLEEVESFVEINLKITKDDCRDWFLATTGINEAKINTISLLTAWREEIDGHYYYQNIRPLTKFNFPNEHLIDTGKNLEIVYEVYY